MHALFTIGLPRTEAPAPYTPEQRVEAVREYSRQVGTPMLRALQTDGHVDNFCCYVAPGEVLLAWTDDERDPIVVKDALLPARQLATSTK